MSHLRRARRLFTSCDILIACHLILLICGTESTFQGPNGVPKGSGTGVDSRIARSANEIEDEALSDVGDGGRTKDLSNGLDFVFNENRNNLLSNSHQSPQQRPIYPGSPEAYLRLMDGLDRAPESSLNDNLMINRLFGRQREPEKILENSPWDSERKLGSGSLFPPRQGSSSLVGRGFNYLNGNNYYSSQGSRNGPDEGVGFDNEPDLFAGVPDGKAVKRTASSAYGGNNMCQFFKLCIGPSGKRLMRQ